MHAHGDDFVIVDMRGKIGQQNAASPKKEGAS
jgi:hypothetical protein